MYHILDGKQLQVHETVVPYTQWINFVEVLASVLTANTQH